MDYEVHYVKGQHVFVKYTIINNLVSGLLLYCTALKANMCYVIYMMRH